MPQNRFIIRRRAFLKTGLAAAAGSAAGCGRRGGGPYWRFFTTSEVRTIEAICEQIIPTDESPGARQAGVAHFIDLQLTRHYKRHQPAYRRGLAAVDAASIERHKKPFADLDFDQQTGILTEIAEREPEFFALVRAHTMQGFYGDPRHGGNRDEVSWKMIGLPNPPVRGRLPYELKDS